MTAAAPAASLVPIGTYGRAVLRGQRTAVLLHGAGMDQSVWTLQGRWLAFHGWNALAVDLPGHGRARTLAPCGSVAGLADWLVEAVLEPLGTPAVLIGHSMGALVALDLAARHPLMVDHLCLLGAAAAMPVHPGLLAAAHAHQPKAVEMIVAWALGPRGQTGGSPMPGGWLMGGARSLLQRCDPAVLAADLGACAAYADGALRAAAIRCPTLLVIGAEDRMTPPPAGRALAALIADARVAVLPRTGHMVMMEAPEETLEAIATFLDA